MTWTIFLYWDSLRSQNWHQSRNKKVKDTLIHLFIQSADDHWSSILCPGLLLQEAVSTMVKRPDTVPTLEGEQRNDKKHVDPFIKKLTCWISFSMIFQLFLSLTLLFPVIFCPFPCQPRLGRVKEEIGDEVILVTQTGSWGNLAEEARPQNETILPTLSPVLWQSRG